MKREYELRVHDGWLYWVCVDGGVVICKMPVEEFTKVVREQAA